MLCNSKSALYYTQDTFVHTTESELQLFSQLFVNKKASVSSLLRNYGIKSLTNV